MKPFELRLANEHLKASRHLKNLNTFIADRTRFGLLPAEHRSLMLRQSELMTQYVEVLEKRLSILGIPV